MHKVVKNLEPHINMGDALQGGHKVCQDARLCAVRLRAGEEGPRDTALPGQVPRPLL